MSTNRTVDDQGTRIISIEHKIPSSYTMSLSGRNPYDSNPETSNPGPTPGTSKPGPTPGTSKLGPTPGSSNQSSNPNPGNPTQKPNTTSNAVNLPGICPYPNPLAEGERPAHGYTHLSRDPHRKERKEHTDGLKIRVNADLALDLNIKGEIYGDLIVGIITDDD